MSTTNCWFGRWLCVDDDGEYNNKKRWWPDEENIEIEVYDELQKDNKSNVPFSVYDCTNDVEWRHIYDSWNVPYNKMLILKCFFSLY